MKATLIHSAIVLGLTLGVAAQAPPTGFEVGQPFPSITLPALRDGQPMSIAQFRGRKVILHIFASW
ncbi:MAG: hypothetical protein D6723_00690 [Acidobacteria bacterium]|nr:MAG: hypothetical protein D6723_00690 [Acidobacteriota bacterium]